MGYVHSYGLTKDIEVIPSEAFSKIEEIVEKWSKVIKKIHEFVPQIQIIFTIIYNIISYM